MNEMITKDDLSWSFRKQIREILSGSYHEKCIKTVVENRHIDVGAYSESLGGIGPVEQNFILG